jgi:hypothetical protein
MARREEEDVDEDGGDIDPVAVEADLAVSEILDQLGGGAQKVSVKLRRELRPQDEGVVAAGYCGRVNKVTPETIEDDIFKLGGGGVYWLEFYVGGAYQKGRNVRIEIDGPAKPRGADGAPAALAAPAPAAPPSGVLTEARLAEILAAQKREDEFERLRREAAELRDELKAARLVPPAAPVGPQAAPVGPMEIQKMVMESTREMERLREKAATTLPPEVIEMREQNKRLQERLEKAEERERQRERDEAKEQAKRLEAKIEAIATGSTKKTRTPLEEMTANLGHIVALKTIFRELKDDDEDDSDLSIGEFIRPFKKQIRQMFDGFAKVAAKRRSDGPPVPPQAPENATPEQREAHEREAWAKWVQTIYQQPALLGDRHFVTRSMFRFSSRLDSLARVVDRPALAAAMGATFGPEAQEEIEGLPEPQLNAILGALATLRQTMQAIAAGVPEPEAPPVAEATADPGDEDEDEDEEVADDDDEDADDEEEDE